MPDLYSVADGDTVQAADVNQYKTVLEGGDVAQYALRQKSGANFIIRLATNNGTDKISIQDSGSNEVASINSDGDIVGNVEPTTLILPSATSPSQTTDAQIVWDSDSDRITVGTGSTTAQFFQNYVSSTASNFTKNNNDTLSDVTGLSFPIGASETWVFQVVAQVNIGQTPDSKWALTLPSGASATGNAGQYGQAASNTLRVSDFTSATALTAALNSTLVRLTGVVVNSTTAGTVQVQMAQNTATSEDSIVYAQSYVVAWRIA